MVLKLYLKQRIIMTLLKDNHPQQDLFIPDIFDNIGAPFKDDMASMEHPIFTLSKKKDMRNIEYKKDNVSVTIKPNTDGLPTIFDKDVLLYCISLLMTEVNAGRVPPKTLRISCRDLLTTTNRRTDGHSYTRLKQALDRLQGVSIKTNIKTNRRSQINAFGLLNSYEVIESHKIKDRMIRLEITLSDWFYNSVLGTEVLTINRDYFRLGKPIERRLYEIARKHCGKSPQWTIGLEKLMEKVGSMGTFRLFRSRLKGIAQDNHLPDYCFNLDDNDKVTFWQKHANKERDALPAKHRFNIFDIQADTLQKAQELVAKAETGWDFNALLDQWIAHIESKGIPKSKDGALIGFIKKKIKLAP